MPRLLRQTGTAVLGLGNIGAAASKPVMEGKAILFKQFGGVDSFDIEVPTLPFAERHFYRAGIGVPVLKDDRLDVELSNGK